MRFALLQTAAISAKDNGPTRGEAVLCSSEAEGWVALAKAIIAQVAEERRLAATRESQLQRRQEALPENLEVFSRSYATHLAFVKNPSARRND
jgi:hypothetical protein